jgi:hypothetical protein
MAYCWQNGHGHLSYWRIYNFLFTPCTCLTLRTSSTTTTDGLSILPSRPMLPGRAQKQLYLSFTLLHDSILNIYNLPQNFQERIWTIKTTSMYKCIRYIQLDKKEQSNYKPNYNTFFSANKKKTDESQTKWQTGHILKQWRGITKTF